MQEHVQVEASKCKACHRCEIACIATHHGLDMKTAMKQKDKYAPRCWAFKGDTFKTSIRCHGCNPAPCCNICPTGALQQNSDGSFEFHMEHCAGCKLCMAVCPYGCISFEQEQQPPVHILGTDQDVQLPPRTVAMRCDLCVDWRAEKGVAYTACMEACMTRALTLIKRDGTLIEAPMPEKKAKPVEANPVEPKPTENPEPVAKPEPKAPVETKPVQPKEEPTTEESPQAEKVEVKEENKAPQEDFESADDSQEQGGKGKKRKSKKKR